MDEKQETIADIVAEMRNYSNTCNDGYHTDYGVVCTDMRNYADRLEAAWKQEVGNAAKMREALEQVASIPMPPPIHLAQQCAREMREKAIAALSEPARNCDRFGTDSVEAMLAYEEVCEKSETEESVADAFSWLFSLAY